jgi:hypothetical protein
MRKLCTIVAGGASGLLVLAVMPALAHAAPIPPCDTGTTNSEFELIVPDEIAIDGAGGKATVRDNLCEVSLAYPWSWDYYSDIGVTYAAADPAAPISHPFSTAISSFDFEESDYNEVSFELPAFDSGDGPAVLTLTWTQSNVYSQNYETRPRSVARQINPTRGHPPEGVRASWDLHTVQKRVHGLKQPNWYTVWDEFIRFEVRPYKPASKGTAEPIKITIKGAGKAHHRTIRSQYDSSVPEFHPGGFHGKRRFKFKATSVGKVLDKGSFKVKYESAFGSRIYQGSDAFVNKCINTNRIIRSRHHRLYCWDYRYPASWDISHIKQSG